MPETLSLRALNRATLARQMLLEREKIPVPRAIARIGGIQAQWPKLPFLALLARVKGFTRDDLAKAYLTHAITRATFFRATIHTVTREDYAELRPLLQRGFDRAAARILTARGGNVDVERMVKLARAYLAEPRTFGEVRAHLMSKKAGPDDRALGYAVRMLLPLVMAPSERERWTFPQDAPFTLAEPFLRVKMTSGEASLPSLVLRFLEAFGPATIGDFSEWSGLPSAKSTFETLRPKLLVFADAKGRELFDVKKAKRPDPDTPAPVRFLPEFDGTIMAHVDRTRFVAEKHRVHVYLPALRVAGAILVDGFAGGSWTIARAKKKATITVRPFAKWTGALRTEVEEEADALVRFHEPDAAEHAIEIGKPV